MAVVGNVGPLQCGDFELRLLGGCVASGGAFDRAVGNFIGGLGAVRAQREGNFQEDVLFVPTGVHLHVDTRNSGVDADVLGEGGILEMLFHTDGSSEGSAFQQLHLIDLVEIPMLFFEVGIDVPGVPFFGLVIKSSAWVVSTPRWYWK